MKPALAFIHKVNQVIINPIILLLFAVAVLVFLYGVFLYVKDSDSEDGRAIGRKHIIWGIFGMFIMISVFGILNIVMNSIGVSPHETGVSEIFGQ
jgi:di/tricarboxylate transporter